MVKGEIFFVVALILTVSLVFMYIPIRKKYLERESQLIGKQYEDKIFENVINEFKRVFYISFSNFSACIENVLDFLNFSEKYLRNKGFTLSSLIMVGNISSSLNLTIINTNDESVLINFTLNSNYTQLLLVNEYSSLYLVFPLEEGQNTLTLEYEDVKKESTFRNIDKLVFYIDIIIEGRDKIKRYIEANVYT